MSLCIFYIITEDWFFVSHFLSWAKAAVKSGYDVAVLTNVNRHQKVIENEGIRVIPINFKRKGINPWHELKIIIKIINVLKKEQPDIIHNIALKPIMYGSIAAKFARIDNVINAIVGLGVVFMNRGFNALIVRRIVTCCYRFVFFVSKSKVIFENNDDVTLFLKNKILKKEQIVLIKGAGVNINEYKFIPEQNYVPIVVFVSRMLWDKGVRELVQASKILKAEKIECQVVLVGSPDNENPAAIPENILEQWNKIGIVEWWGRREDIPDILSKSNIAVLPSYREGLPKSLIEAASCGRAIVATDVPGCREIVRHNENGLLVPPHDSKSLADALKVLIKDPELRAKMGAKGRKIVEAEFSEEIVVRKTMEVYERLLSQKRDRC